MAVAQENSEILIEQINSLDLSMEYTNPFGWSSYLKTFKREAEKLQATQVVKASIIQGMIACLMHDYQTMRIKHENAIKNSPGFYLAHFNYAQSLCRAGFYEEAVPHYEKAIALAPMELAYYSAAIQNYALLGLWSKGNETLSRLKALTNDVPQLLEEYISMLVDALNTYSIDQETIAAIKKVADDFLHQKKLTLHCRNSH